MSSEISGKYLVAVIGAGPAGLFAARQLALNNVHVVLINRDIKPGGLAEYGIYYDKYKMKEGLRRQFHQILESPQIEYYGNLSIGQKADFTLPELRAIGFQALLVTVGAQGTKWLGLPGEDMLGVYHAKDLVYHYNRLPPFSQYNYPIGRRVALIGAGNVMIDIARWVIRDLKVDEVIAVVRRGPAEVKFTKKELEGVARNLDLTALEAEFTRIAPIMDAVGQDPHAAKAFILSALPKADDATSNTRFRFEFLASPRHIIGGERGSVRGLEVEDTTLLCAEGEVQAKRLGTIRLLEVETVIFCIGDKVDDTFGLPVRWNAFVKNPNPHFPIDGLSYEAFDPNADHPIDRVFVAGWSREASSGLVGVARKDGESGAQAVLQYLQTQPLLRNPAEILQDWRQHLDRLKKPVVTNADLLRLEAVEQAERQKRTLEDYKFSSNDEMLAVMGLNK